MVHGYESVSTAFVEYLCWLELMLKEKFEITTDGHDEESKKQIKVLNRFIFVGDGGYTCELDVRN